MSSFKLLGIQVRIHPLFWLVIIAAALTGQFIELITLFTLVAMHELGHVLMALAVGWRVTSMELLPFGGVAKVDEWGTTAVRDEVLVALSGPFVNVVMIGMGAIFLAAGLWSAEWAEFFILGNFLIASFNLLPIWPLDGGKVLQAILTQMMPFRQSVVWCLAWSIMASGIMLSLSLFLPNQVNLMVISLYLLLENRYAWKQIHYQFIRFLLAKRESIKKQYKPMRTVFFTLDPCEKISEVVKLFKKGCYHQFRVRDEKNHSLVLLDEETVLSAYFEKSPWNTVSDLLAIH